MSSDKDNLSSQLQALHRILTNARTNAYRGTSPQNIGRMLDDAEYLVVLMMNERQQEDANEEFWLLIQDMKKKYTGLDYVTTGFEAQIEEAMDSPLAAAVK